jgi:hypothetical protein
MPLDAPISPMEPHLLYSRHGERCCLLHILLSFGLSRNFKWVGILRGKLKLSAARTEGLVRHCHMSSGMSWWCWAIGAVSGNRILEPIHTRDKWTQHQTHQESIYRSKFTKHQTQKAPTITRALSKFLFQVQVLETKRLHDKGELIKLKRGWCD